MLNMPDIKNKIKIIYILPTLDKGGAERFITDLLLNLNRDIFDPTLLLFVRGGEWAKELEEKNIPIITLQKKHRLDLVNFLQICQHIRNIKPHIVHTQQGGDIYGRLAAKILKIPIIVSTEHNVNRDEAKIISLLKRISATWALKIFAISEAVKNDAIERYHLSSDKFTIIYNGVNINKFPPKTVQEYQKKINFGTIGRLVPQKGQITLIAAWEKLKNLDINCSIAGLGPLKYDLEKKINSSQLSGKIKLIGAVNSPNFLNSLDAFILPSIWEGFGIVLLEAGLTGLPIIASAVDGITEIIDDNTGWLVPANDIQALSDKIAWLATNINSAEVRQKVKNLQDRIIKEFDIKKMTRNYEYWYQKLLAKIYEDRAS